MRKVTRIYRFFMARNLMMFNAQTCVKWQKAVHKRQACHNASILGAKLNKKVIIHYLFFSPRSEVKVSCYFFFFGFQKKKTYAQI
jgi:hypothetical protein